MEFPDLKSVHGRTVIRLSGMGKVYHLQGLCCQVHAWWGKEKVSLPCCYLVLVAYVLQASWQSRSLSVFGFLRSQVEIF